MPQKQPIIPGGKPRSSSVDDVLDLDGHEGLCGTLFVNINDRNTTNCTDGPRRSVGRTHMAAHTTSTGNLNYSDDAFDSDSKHSSGSSALSGRKGLTLKSVRKAVSRVFVKESKFTDTVVKRQETRDLLKVWTPDIKHLEEKVVNKSSELPFSGTLSSARPLITNSHIGMPVPKWKRTPGTVGIYNHGNNCFMNAILQCLSNTDSFTEYFIRDFFKNDLKNSAHGKKGVFRSSHGKVTEQLGLFLKCLWSGKYTREVSEEFKAVVAKFNSQYEGDDQHDAQEFLLWLLDRIHEDVSTFAKRKAKPQKTILTRTDKELASEAALANGESFVLKLFQALHSSTLTCSACGEHSNTFDPYLCLSLPLPQGYQRVVYVIVVFLDTTDSHQVMMAFTLHQYDEVRELRELVASHARIPAKQLLFVQLDEDCFGTTYHDEQPLSDIPENETLYAFEVHPENVTKHNSTQEFDSPLTQVLVMHVEVTGESTDSFRFCSPAVLRVRRDITWKDLHMEILKKMERSLSDDAFASQKLNGLFLLRLYDGNSRSYYLPSDVELPLYTQTVERAFSASRKNCGLPHIKIIAEWDTQTKSRFVTDDREHIETSVSVKKLQNNPLDQGKVTLEECFRLYTKEEKLIGDDAWLCPHCKHQQQGTIKALSLWSLPDVLVLHLKRFKQSGPRRSKLNTLIDFPVDGLDMSALVSRNSHPSKNDDYTYDLMAVSNHYGNMMGGHYTAYCRNPIDGKWREYDDAKVKTLGGSVVTKEAYLLFYQRRSLSKTVNQRLFNGDHWIYSLPLSPSENISENSATNLGSELTQQVRNSRSRSASPSTRRQGNKNKGVHPMATSMTPQPIRRPMKPFVEDKEFSDEILGRSPSLKNGNASRRSRSLQRQSSGSRSKTRRDASMENSVGSDIMHRSSPNKDKRENDMDQMNSFRPKWSSDVSRPQTDTSRRSADVDSPPSAVVSMHDSPTSKDISISTSKNTNHDLLLNNKAQDIRISPPSSAASGIMQKKQENKSNNQSSASPHDSPSLSQGENAARKLANIMKENINRARTHAAKTDNVDNSGKSEFRKHQTVNKVNGKHSLHDTTVSQASINDNDHHVHSSASDTISTDNEYPEHQHTDSLKTEPISASHSLSTKNTVGGPDLIQGQSVGSGLGSGLKQKLNDESSQFDQPLKTHPGLTNGLPAPGQERHTSRFLDDVGILNSGYTSAALSGNASSQDKSATIDRTWNTSQASRYKRNGIPHSNTDHNIHYGHHHPEPPPLPASVSHGEKQAFIPAADSSSLQSSTSGYVTSSQRTNKLAHSSFYSESSQQNNQNSFRSRTLPGHIPGSRTSRYKFQRPRGVFSAQAELARQLASNSNPCLRESSV